MITCFMFYLYSHKVYSLSDCSSVPLSVGGRDYSALETTKIRDRNIPLHIMKSNDGINPTSTYDICTDYELDRSIISCLKSHALRIQSNISAFIEGCQTLSQKENLTEEEFLNCKLAMVEVGASNLDQLQETLNQGFMENQKFVEDMLRVIGIQANFNDISSKQCATRLRVSEQAGASMGVSDGSNNDEFAFCEIQKPCPDLPSGDERLSELDRNLIAVLAENPENIKREYSSILRGEAIREMLNSYYDFFGTSKNPISFEKTESCNNSFIQKQNKSLKLTAYKINSDEHNVTDEDRKEILSGTCEKLKELIFGKKSERRGYDILPVNQLDPEEQKLRQIYIDRFIKENPFMLPYVFGEDLSIKDGFSEQKIDRCIDIESYPEMYSKNTALFKSNIENALRIICDPNQYPDELLYRNDRLVGRVNRSEYSAYATYHKCVLEKLDSDEKFNSRLKTAGATFGTLISFGFPVIGLGYNFGMLGLSVYENTTLDTRESAEDSHSLVTGEYGKIEDNANESTNRWRSTKLDGALLILGGGSMLKQGVRMPSRRNFFRNVEESTRDPITAAGTIKYAFDNFYNGRYVQERSDVLSTTSSRWENGNSRNFPEGVNPANIDTVKISAKRIIRDKLLQGLERDSEEYTKVESYINGLNPLLAARLALVIKKDEEDTSKDFNEEFRGLPRTRKITDLCKEVIPDCPKNYKEVQQIYNFCDGNMKYCFFDPYR